MTTRTKSSTKQPSARSRTTKTSPRPGNVQLLDAEGNVQLKALSHGVFTLRFTPDLKQVTVAWMPDDKVGTQAQKKFKAPTGNLAGGDVGDFGACLQQQSYNSTDELLAAIARCTSEIFK